MTTFPKTAFQRGRADLSFAMLDRRADRDERRKRLVHVLDRIESLIGVEGDDWQSPLSGHSLDAAMKYLDRIVAADMGLPDEIAMDGDGELLFRWLEGGGASDIHFCADGVWRYHRLAAGDELQVQLLHRA